MVAELRFICYLDKVLLLNRSSSSQNTSSFDIESKYRKTDCEKDGGGGNFLQDALLSPIESQLNV